MKRFSALLLTVIVLISLAGCEMPDIAAKIKNFDIAALINNEPDWDAVTIEELQTGSRLKYYFSRLSSKEKQAYNNILAEIESMPADIEVPSLNQTELTTVFEALLYDNPYLFFLGRSCTITKKGITSYFNAEYIMTVSEYNQKKQELTEISAEVLKSFKAKSELETELYIHDYIVTNCSYENNGAEDESNAYGALLGKSAACEGYSKAAKVLFDMAGIDCYVISGMSDDFNGRQESHMWNIVKINGNYYHLDLTWDDPVGAGSENKNGLIYTYFNITDEEIKKTHSDFTSANICTATADNYFVIKGLLFSTYNENTKSKIAKGIAAAADDGRTILEIKFSGPDVYAQAFTGLFQSQQIYDILTAAGRSTNKNISDASVSYIQNNTFNIIELILEY